MHAKSLQVCLTVRAYGLQPSRFLCPWDSRGKNIGMGGCAVLSGIVPARDQPESLSLPVMAGGFSTTSPTGKPKVVHKCQQEMQNYKTPRKLRRKNLYNLGYGYDSLGITKRA